MILVIVGTIFTDTQNYTHLASQKKGRTGCPILPLEKIVTLIGHGRQSFSPVQ
ncbi:MAG: hypothetical protein AB7H80_06365 [Candidatus Kapaibacterium sp.]